MKQLLIILLLSASAMKAQNWVRIPKTQILFSHYIQDKEDNFSDFSFEYFKKGDSLISVAKFLAKDFLNVFAQSPKAFDDLYKAAYQVTDKSDLMLKTADPSFFYLDSIIAGVAFKTTVVITDRHFVQGENEFIWMLTNGSGSPGNEPCYINMVFQKSKKKEKPAYLSTVKDHCEI